MIRRWRRENRAVYNQQWRQDNLQQVTQRELRRRDEMRQLAPTTVTGRYPPAEDQVILTWNDSEIALAQALGRSWESVRGRKRELRTQGRLDRPAR